MRAALVILFALVLAGCASPDPRPHDATGAPRCRDGEAPAPGDIPEARAVNQTRAWWSHKTDGAPMNATAMARPVILTGDGLLFERGASGACGALIGGANTAAPSDGKAHDAWDVQLRGVPDPNDPSRGAMDVWIAFVDTTSGDIVATEHVM